MFGFVVGTLCLIGFTKVAFGQRWGYHRYRRAGCGPGYGHGRYGYCGDGGGCYPSGGYGRGHGFSGLYHAFERLNTSPGQEKAIRASLDDLRENLSALRPSLRTLRGELAAAFKQERFDAGQAESVLHSRDADLAQAHAAIATALSRIHEALDPDQREQVARFLDRGPRWFW